MRILLDTNLWVAGLISASMRIRIERIIANDQLEILTDIALLSELKAVCARPKFSRYFSASQLQNLFQILHERLFFVETKSRVNVCRDPDDNFLLAICLDGQADYLLTGDDDLLVLNAFGQTKIITITQFEQILSKV
jgi:hypothetical protein